jgi:hypothetical protein
MNKEFTVMILDNTKIGGLVNDPSVIFIAKIGKNSFDMAVEAIEHIQAEETYKQFIKDQNDQRP